MYIRETVAHQLSTPTVECFVKITSATNSPVTHERTEGRAGGSDGRRERGAMEQLGAAVKEQLE